MEQTAHRSRLGPECLKTVVAGAAGAAGREPATTKYRRGVAAARPAPLLLLAALAGGLLRGAGSQAVEERAKVVWRAPDGTTLALDNGSDHLNLDCERGSVLSCGTLSAAGEALRVMVRRRLRVAGCTLRAPLACMPGAATVSVLVLYHTRELSAGVLGGLSALSTLQIDAGENVTFMPYAALSVLPALRSFVARDGFIETIAAGRVEGKLGGLRDLEVSRNRLRRLPAAGFTPTPNVTTLSLWGNLIEDIHVDAFQGLAKLQVLNLNTNNISWLPREVYAPCLALRELHLSSNRLSAVDAVTASGARSLTTVDLSANELEVLPLYELGGLPLLESLDLSDNRLRTILGAYRDNLTEPLLRLTKLDLSHNNLTALGRSGLEGLVALQELDLSYNGLAELDAADLSVLRHRLTDIRLSNNGLRINCLGGSGLSPLSELVALRHVELRGGRVAGVCKDWRSLVHLQSIDLSHNHITRLMARDLQWMSPAVLNLSHNRITVVHPPPRALSTLALEGNPFACDCELYSFVHAAGDRVTDYDRLRCASPPELEGTPLASARRLPCTDCTPRCACAVDAEEALYELRCPAPPTRYPSTDLTIRLTLTNKTSVIPDLPPNVKYLDLRDLNMTLAPTVGAAGVELDLRGNRLAEIPRELLVAGRRARLARNPLRCECGAEGRATELPAALRGHEGQVLDLAEVTCAPDAGGSCGPPGTTTTGTVLLAAAPATLCLVCGILLCNRTFRARVRKRIDGCGGWRGARGRGVFVSCADEDEVFVWAHVVPALERGGVAALVPARDWRPGASVGWLTARSVRRARWTVAILSPHYGRCGWRRWALAEAVRSGRAVVLLRAGGGEVAAPRGCSRVVSESDPRMSDKLVRAVRW